MTDVQTKTAPKLQDDLAVVLLSGGLDSLLCAALAKDSGKRVLALTIDYNQRHKVELQAATRIAAALGVERHVILPIDLRAFGGSALTDESLAVPEFSEGQHIPVTYVPARNTIFLSLALGWAEASGARHIYTGVNAVDYSGYPDCRPAFVAAFADLARLATKAGVEGDPFQFQTPLLHMSKADIVRTLAEVGPRVGVDAGMSWSCYDPQYTDDHGTDDLDGSAASVYGRERPVKACGKCDSCALRAQGFRDAGVPDPTDYA